MTDDDILSLTTLLADVYAFYRRDFSDFVADVWIEAMKPFDIAAIRQAMTRHAMNPDKGHLLPYPSDVVKMLQGSTQDSALVAWSKVERTLVHKGTWVSVVFDDALIHRVIADMGGWTPLGTKTSKEFPFVQNEFVNRYRGYRMRGECPEYPRILTGIAEAENESNNRPIATPLLVGDPSAAERVMRGGSKSPALGFSQLDPARLLSSTNTTKTICCDPYLLGESNDRIDQHRIVSHAQKRGEREKPTSSRTRSFARES